MRGMNSLKKISDITFIGSGISTSFTLINFLDLLEKNTKTNKICIDVIDKYSEFNTGIPYSSRSGFSTLLITSLRNFLPEPELSKFIIWLNINKEWLLNEYIKDGGTLSKKWCQNHRKEIKDNDWKDLFIPRRFFGIYINQRVRDKIELLESKNRIKVRFINSEAHDISKAKNIFNVLLDNGKIIPSKKVILSVGSLPVNNLWKESSLTEEDNLMFINRPYSPQLNTTLDSVKKFLKKRKQTNKKTNVLIIGANASALELLYKLNDITNPHEHKLSNFVFLSTQGRIPDAHIDEKRKKEFVPINLNKLQRESSLTANTIAQAAFDDIEISDKINLGAASTVNTISSAFGALLSKLEYSELEKFACYHGNEIGKKQRCAGIHYTNTVNELTSKKRFNHIAGRFIDLEAKGDEYLLKYLDTKTQKETLYNEKFHLVINCIGGMNFTNDKVPKLLRNLIDKKYCEINESKIGFRVNNSLEASDNLHVMGPLLAGNVINNNAVWHAEHCGRIIWLSGMLSKVIYDSVRIEKTNNALSNAKSECYNSLENLEIIKDKKCWDAFLNDIGTYDFYHTYDYHKLSASNGENPMLLKYVENDVTIGLPLLIRDIYSTIYKDATSVYGYVGPISKGINKDFDNSNFIKEITKYFNENNIVSVFSRLNPYMNYQNEILHGCGDLTSKGKVVNININLSPPEQKSQYRSRLKTYINKARRECSIISGSTEQDLDKFIELYYENMDKVNAKEYYFFKKAYFQNLINSKDFETILLFALNNQSKEIIGASMFIVTNSIVQYHLSGTKSEYSKLNPTKLLIDEMRVIATNKGLEIFNLGGGLGGRVDDSLFHFKSSFSKEFKDFYLWKWIVNQKVYDELVLTKRKNIKENYFPLYRNIEDTNVQM